MKISIKKIILSAFLIAIFIQIQAQTSGDFSADSLTTVKSRGKERTVLKGNAYLRTGETEIHADQIEMYGENNRYALCTGNVEVRDEAKGIFLTSNELFYDTENEIMRVEGQSEMIDQKNEIVVRGGFLEDFGNDEITIIQIGVRILKKDMACRSEFARYDRKNETLELSGMPVVYRDEDVFQASRIFINLKTDEITLEGNVSGTIQNETTSPAGEEGEATEEGENDPESSESEQIESSRVTPPEEPSDDGN